MVDAYFMLPQRGYDQKGRVGIEMKQIEQPIQGLTISPVQIVEEQQECSWTLAFGPKHGVRQRLEKARALPGLGQRARARQPRAVVQQRRLQARKFDQPRVIQGSQAGQHRRCAQPLRHRRVGQSAAASRRVAMRHGCGNALAGYPGDQLFGQTGFADAGFAG